MSFANEIYQAIKAEEIEEERFGTFNGSRIFRTQRRVALKLERVIDFLMFREYKNECTTGEQGGFIHPSGLSFKQWKNRILDGVFYV